VTQVTEVRAIAPDTAFDGDVAALPLRSLTMKSNVGGIDRILRIVLGLVLIGLTLTGNIGVWGWLGLVLLATAAIGFCPLYPLIGFSSCPMKKT
jgi:Protein of unknown function (DUF2892)